MTEQEELDLEAWAQSDEAQRLLLETAEDGRRAVEAFQEFTKPDPDLWREPMSI